MCSEGVAAHSFRHAITWVEGVRFPRKLGWSEVNDLLQSLGQKWIEQSQYRAHAHDAERDRERHRR
jgi:hypothetical protein